MSETRFKTKHQQIVRFAGVCRATVRAKTDAQSLVKSKTVARSNVRFQTRTEPTA